MKTNPDAAKQRIDAIIKAPMIPSRFQEGFTCGRCGTWVLHAEEHECKLPPDPAMTNTTKDR